MTLQIHADYYMVQILHISDTHLGCEHRGSKSRRKDFRDSFKACVDIAIENEYDAVIHTGDLFHRNTPRPSEVDFCMRHLRRLEKNDIPIYFVLGNHEIMKVSDVQWIEMIEGSLSNVYLLGENPYMVDNVALYGVDYSSNLEADSIDLQKNNAKFAIFCVHQEISDMVGYETSSISSEELVEELPRWIDLVAAGDIHKREMRDVNGTEVSYAGSPERTQLSQDGNRTICKIYVEDDKLMTKTIDISYRKENIPRPLHKSSITLQKDTTKDDIREKIISVAEGDPSGKMLDIDVEGEPPSDLSTGEVRSMGFDLGAEIMSVSGLSGSEFDLSVEQSEVSDEKTTNQLIEDSIRDSADDDDIREFAVDIVNEQTNEPREYIHDIIDGDKDEVQ